MATSIPASALSPLPFSFLTHAAADAHGARLAAVLMMQVCVCVCGFPQPHTVLLFCRGVVRVDVNLQDVDIDQCSSDGWFAGTHRCNATTMEVSDLTAARMLATMLTRLLDPFVASGAAAS